MSNKEEIRIFCPTHEAAFETAKGSKIICEIIEHALATDFPNSEFWEFCCNCETFSPSNLDRGEKARKNCYGCGNTITKRFACDSCKTFIFESDVQTKGKSYFINATGIEPDCPGCKTTSQNIALYRHKCGEINTDFFTARTICPFCLEQLSVSKTPSSPYSSGNYSTMNCPQCSAEVLPNAIFCGKCKYKLQTDIAIPKPGTDINKTQLLGSLCPNCSTPIPPDSDFCGECGQAVKKSVAPPPPPPPPKQISKDDSLIDISPIESQKSFFEKNQKNITIAGGAFVFLFIILGVISVSRSTNNSSLSPNINVNSSQKSSSNSINSNSTRETSFSVINRYGYITTNVNIRNGPDRRYEDIGTLYQNTRVKILQVSKREDSSDWWEVIVESQNDYGCSAVDSSRCGKDEYNDANQGWINSKFVEFR